MLICVNHSWSKKLLICFSSTDAILKILVHLGCLSVITLCSSRVSSSTLISSLVISTGLGCRQGLRTVIIHWLSSRPNLLFAATTWPCICNTLPVCNPAKASICSAWSKIHWASHVWSLTIKKAILPNFLKSCKKHLKLTWDQIWWYKSRINTLDITQINKMNKSFKL